MERFWAEDVQMEKTWTLSPRNSSFLITSSVGAPFEQPPHNIMVGAVTTGRLQFMTTS